MARARLAVQSGDASVIAEVAFPLVEQTLTAMMENEKVSLEGEERG